MIKTCIKCSKIDNISNFMKGRNICKDCKSIYDKEYRKKRGEEYLQMKRDYYKNNKEKVNDCVKKYREKNKDKMRKIARDYARNRSHVDIDFKLKRTLRRRLNNAINRNQKKGSAVRDLGCSIEFFKNYFKQKFRGNMNWTNHGTVWEIDHIIPLCNFDLNNKNELKAAVHYTNLQPLFISENRIKGGKLWV